MFESINYNDVFYFGDVNYILEEGFRENEIPDTILNILEVVSF